MISVIAALMTASLLQAKPHEHGAHVHGHGEISIAFDGSTGRIDLQGPGESIVGFEHAAKKAKDKAQVESAFGRLEKKIDEIVKFDASLKCVIKKDQIEAQADDDGPYANIKAVFSVTCAKSPKGTTISFAPATVFPKLKDVDVVVLIDDLQKSAQARSKGVEIPL